MIYDVFLCYEVQLIASLQRLVNETKAFRLITAFYQCVGNQLLLLLRLVK